MSDHFICANALSIQVLSYWCLGCIYDMILHFEKECFLAWIFLCILCLSWYWLLGTSIDWISLALEVHLAMLLVGILCLFLNWDLFQI